MKIALAHDSFTQTGGAERVIEALHQMFPNAPVYTLVFDEKFIPKYQSWDIRSSWLQRFYNVVPKLQYWLFLIPLAVRSLNFKGYDLIISSSSGFVKNITVPKGCRHINYCHTPTRFLWTDKAYVRQEVPLILRPFVMLFLRWMRKWDFRGSQRVSSFIANSKTVQNRIQQYYHCSSAVVYPGIDTSFWRPTRQKQNYFLLAGRLQAHKKSDLIVEIFNELDLPLHIVGIGRQLDYLKKIAKPNVQFLGQADDMQLRDEYSGALGFIYPQIEDFGLMPLEAAACGTASIGIAQGGNLETIIPSVTGELFADYSKEKIKQLILSWNVQKYQADQLWSQAEKFNIKEFKKSFYELVTV